MWNRTAPIKVSDLPRGVSKNGNRFQGQIWYEGKKYNLGTYATPEEASEVYEAQAALFFGDFYHAPE
jgi:hypothetical protein